VYFDVPVRADVFAVAAEHVVYNEIVVPGSEGYEEDVFHQMGRNL